MAEYRISIYGRKQSEWDQLASWIVNNELYSENVVWLIQVLTVSKSLLLKFMFFWSLKGKVG
jgi:adenosine deaminase